VKNRPRLQINLGGFEELARLLHGQAGNRVVHPEENLAFNDPLAYSKATSRMIPWVSATT
jgi:hypothetical protein